MAETNTTAELIPENDHVKEHLVILRENNSPSTKDGVLFLVTSTTCRFEVTDTKSEIA